MVTGKKLINGEWLSEEECIEKHGGLIWVAVKKVLKGRSIPNWELDDLMSEGTIGLITAYRRYEDSRGYKFSTYAVKTIWGTVMVYRNKNTSIIKESRTMGKLRREMGEDLLDLTAKELSVKYDIPIEQVDLVRRSFQPVLSIEAQILTGEDENTGKVNPGEVIGEYDDISNLYVTDFLNSLTERQRAVLLQLTEGCTQKEIGQQLGVVQAQISRDLAKIRKAAEKWDKVK